MPNRRTPGISGANPSGFGLGASSIKTQTQPALLLALSLLALRLTAAKHALAVDDYTLLLALVAVLDPLPPASGQPPTNRNPSGYHRG